MTVLVYPMLPDIRSSTTSIRRFPKPLPLVLLIRLLPRHKQVLSNSGMIVTRGNRRTWKNKPVFNIILLPTRRYLNCTFPLKIFRLKLYMQNILFPMRATHAAHPMHLVLTTWRILDEYKVWSSSLCNFLQPPSSISFVHPHSLRRTLYSSTPSIHFLP